MTAQPADVTRNLRIARDTLTSVAELLAEVAQRDLAAQVSALVVEIDARRAAVESHAITESNARESAFFADNPDGFVPSLPDAEDLAPSLRGAVQ